MTSTPPKPLTDRALHLAQNMPERYARLLELLTDCKSSYYEPFARARRRGASYKKLAATGRVVWMNKGERIGWYRVCEPIPLSDHHADYILDELKRMTG